MIYVADLNYIMLLFAVGLGHERLHKSWVGLGYRKWTHGHVCTGWQICEYDNKFIDVI